MSYVLLNPVVVKMYGVEFLNTLLENLGYIMVSANEDWPNIVKKKYQKRLKEADGQTIIDMRCPLSSSLIKEKISKESICFPDIEPILIHCAREISERIDLIGSAKLVITPCESLAIMGNNLNLNQTQFLTWKNFLKQEGVYLDLPRIEMTPIPLGYFDNLGYQVKSLSVEKDIINYFETNNYEDVDIVEVLYCELGCHNGDGVT